MAGKNNAKIIWEEGLRQVGIDPKTGLPLKLGMGRRCNTKEDMKRQFRDQDKRINANMFEWYNTLLDLKSQDINRLLYFRGQLAFAYLDDVDECVLLPFAIDGNLDMYGRAKYIRLLPFCSSSEDPRMKPVEDYLASKRFRVINTLKEDYGDLKIGEAAVILYDYTPSLSNNVIPQSVLNDTLIDLESEIYAFIRVAAVNATGISAIRVNEADQKAIVDSANLSLIEAASRCESFVPVVGSIDWQQLTVESKTSELLQIAQAIHNLRMSLNGLPSGGVYDKSQYVNDRQASINQGEVDSALVLQDKLTNREEFCNIVADFFGIPIDCVPSENIIQADMDQNGVLYDDADPETQLGGEEND